jgi:hypothetical protein
MTATRLLSIYLRDHHAGAVAGTSLASRTAGANEGTAYGEELARLRDEIEEDRRTLEALMERLGVSQDRLKDASAGVAERLGRLKRNGRLLSYSPLSRLVELESLALGVTGKLSLWRSLREAHGEVVAGTDIRALEARAENQRERIEELRLRASADALRSD